MTKLKHTDELIRHNGIGLHFRRTPVEFFSQRHGPMSVTPLDDGEKLVLDGLRTFTIGSVVSYALKTGRDPVEALDSARENGHELVWINGNGSMISSTQGAPEHLVQVEVGMQVHFEGRYYTIENAPNKNLQLKPLVTATVEA